jgi:hypothetical protein
MLGYFTRKRIIALFFCFLFTVSNLIPVQAWALTSGPTQPEMSGFQPAGVSDMVDVFTGDFKYNIPLLDVDGYPVNLSYQSGVGMDDEASWVGLGWSLNVGSINRQLRGVPDDFSGDQVTSDFYTKPKVTIGGEVYVKPEIKGKLGPALQGKFSLGVFNDNYTGIGASVGVNGGVDVNLINAGENTVGLGLSAGLGISSNTSSGVDVSPSVSLSISNRIKDNITASIGLSTSIGYNTRSGLKDLTLSQSFSMGKLGDKGRISQDGTLDLGGSSYFFNSEAFYPKPQISYQSSHASFTPSVGGAAYLGFTGAGGTGYVNLRSVKNRVVKKPAYGFLYGERGKDVPEALMDFTREKDNPIIPELPNLAVPVHSPDLFSFSSQTGAGQFRLYRGGTGVLFDDLTKDESKSVSGGADFGFGAYFHGGVSLYDQHSTSATQKWTKNNNYFSKGDFQKNDGDNPNDDPVYFKQVGEKTASNSDIEAIIQGDSPIAVNIANRVATDELKYNTSTVSSSISEIKKSSKVVKRAAISFLTANQAKRGGALDKKINNFSLLNEADLIVGNVNPQTANSFLPIERTSLLNYRRPNHISEFTVTDEVGKRMVYGLPVYNKTQEEYTFNVGVQIPNDQNQVSIPKDGSGNISTKNKGVDEYFTKQIQPAYATSFLLTGILSSDYVDLKSDGITDDDRGTAIKFNYSRHNDFKWRTPLEAGKASYNQGLLADNEDEKGNIIYGEKELWYVHSIETKTKIAYFVLGNRSDALGVLNWNGGINTSNTQKCLKKIILYSKADLSKPIKIVEFNYNYQLCKNVPNHDPNSTDPDKGKLSLTQVFFKYGNSPKGAHHTYKFNYNNTATYNALSSDRWGTYKEKDANKPDLLLRNDEYPYTIQDKTKADAYSSQWLLNKIELPTGGIINVTYESDDYAYVQNKRAMKMVRPENLVKDDGTQANLKTAKKIVLNISDNPDQGVDQTKWFKDKYLNGSDYIYGKLYVKIATGLLAVPGYENDFVVNYARVQNVVVANGIAYIRLEDVSEGGVTVNAFCIAAWQKMRCEYPKYAYPGYENRPTQTDPVSNYKATVSAIFNAFKNLGELKETFYQRANRKDFATVVDFNKSFFRITDQTGKKYGGGCRVKKLTISDEWNTMTSAANTVVYGTEYDYTITEGGQVISSGVGSFEPSLGGDENPLRQPISYQQKIKGALSNMFYLEQPFGESFFPAPSVGYRKVTIKNIDETGAADPENETGQIVNEFYTAKEFPTLVSETPMQKNEVKPKSKMNLFGGLQYHELVLSQGYAIYLNDMHGKARKEQVFDKKGSLISSTEYIYNADNLSAGEWQLNNYVQVIEENGDVTTKALGRDIEMYTDMRESEFISLGTSFNLGGDVFPIPFPPFVAGLPHWPKKNNDEIRLFRSACIAKVVQSFGIIQKVIKVQNGSQVAAENIAFDPNTGDVLITKTHNEFKQDIFSVTIPAYWIYKEMGGAYKTLGTFIKSFKTDVNGIVEASPINDFIQPGDELTDASGNIYWVIESKATINGVEQTSEKRIINKSGNIATAFAASGKWVKIIRSGNRNLISNTAATIVCMENPIKSESGIPRLKFSKNEELKEWKVIDAKATVFNENWTGDWNVPCQTCPSGYVLSEDGQSCEMSLNEDLSFCFSLCPGTNDVANSIDGAFIKETLISPWVNKKSSYWGGEECSGGEGGGQFASLNSKTSQGSAAILSSPSTDVNSNECNVSTVRDVSACSPLNRSGVWFCKSNTNNERLPLNQWIGLETYISVSTTKTYYLGYGANDRLRVYVNNYPLVLNNTAIDANYKRWNVIPVSLNAGKNRIRIEGYNDLGGAAMGVEIYNNTYTQLINETGINRIFTTDNLLYSANRVYTYVYNADNTISARYTCTDGSIPDVLDDVNCDRFKVSQLNPYVQGFKGNWRPLSSHVFQVNRSYGNEAIAKQNGINIRKDGHYKEFAPFWVFNSSWGRGTLHLEKWVTANTMSLYDRYGQELENKNALDLYSAASFGFLGNMAVAIASNSRNREILYESFEDMNFRKNNRGNYAVCDTNMVSFDAYANNINSVNAHSGKYSLQLNANVSLKTKIHTKDHLSEAYLATDEKGAYNYKNVIGLYALGFQPMPNKTYVFSAWIYDGQPLVKTFSATVSIAINGVQQNITLQRKATVEGWKLIEGNITIPSSVTTADLDININGTAGMLLDDVRIFPKDGQVKTFAYNESNFRLMAELDENNFATFYEYDDEGILNRVKKETERGIMTIKETRSTYKKGN